MRFKKGILITFVVISTIVAFALVQFPVSIKEKDYLVSPTGEIYYLGYTPPKVEPLTVPLPLEYLPDAFDWRDFANLSPARNQGPHPLCGIFAVTGMVENCAIIWDELDELDLSEQWPYDCAYGSDMDYWIDELDECGLVGQVLEVDCPYDGDISGECEGCPYGARTTIVGYGYVEADLESLKTAIKRYGPIVTSVNADGFHEYTGGVFEHVNNDPCNHAVVLVGWNDDYYEDDTDVGVWYLRNSWGTNWGENGYMNIVYDANHVGSGGNKFIDYTGEEPPPVICWRCNYDIEEPEYEIFPSGTTCGEGTAIEYPYDEMPESCVLTEEQTPGFELIVLLISLVSLVLLLKKR